MLVALKCDLREKHSEEEEDAGDNTQAQGKEGKEFIDYKQGLEVARRIQALRYLGEIGRFATLLPTTNNNANIPTRMFCKKEPRRQRSIHRSCSGGSIRQGPRRITR